MGPFVMYAIVAALSYLLGSIPFGIVVSRLFGLGDLRSIGSGNIGATNVLRTGNRLAAFLTLVLDVGKGAFAVVVARALFGDLAGLVAGVAAFLGHCFPLYLGFKGGKGVATFIGTVLALAWPVGLGVCAAWLVTALIFRISSLAALVSAVAAPVLAMAQGAPALAAGCTGMALLIFLRHKANIVRLLDGTEPRIGKKE